jgi:hypothetical protein
MDSDRESRSGHIRDLAREIIEDVERSRLPPETIVLKASRLAKIADAPVSTLRWLMFEQRGYNPQDPISLEYMGHTGRWIDVVTRKGVWVPLAECDAEINVREVRLKGLTPETTGYREAHEHINTIKKLRGIRARVLALVHAFAANLYYEKVFSGLAESIFEHRKQEIDALLANRCADALEKVPALCDRLREGDGEAVSQALTTCRRIIDTFADSECGWGWRGRWRSEASSTPERVKVATTC